ncbi:unnamed protein product [Clonostachys rosea]|uniref:Xylanolytic transcriptional activator regulatory domain-containing protein n=1 Tax=Bionectria ochroleuca TaxID=29856 RepID=A0ABY6UN95_BIOOC|nr:unnamed protein product [Clonostachys rosea]
MLYTWKLNSRGGPGKDTAPASTAEERLVNLLESRFNDVQFLDEASKQSKGGSANLTVHSPSLRENLEHLVTENQAMDSMKSPPSLLNDDYDLTSPYSSLQSSSDGPFLFTVPELVVTELVHLFFNIIQPWFPLLHRPRFFERYLPNGGFSRESVSRYSDADITLLCSMCSLSARYSSNAYFKDIMAPDRGTRFADDATNYYGRFCTSEKRLTLKYLQASLLLALYLYSSGSFHRGWILAGFCVRLAYELELCTTDEGEEDNWDDPARWSSMEERRRTFWLVWMADNFGSILSRRPRAINRHELLVRLPVSDVAWFANKPVKSPRMSSRPSKAWKILLDSPNQDEGAWYIVANYLMVVACELASARNASQSDQDELVQSVACFSLVLSQRFSLETHASLHLENPTSHNYIIGMHLMLACARGCILSFDRPRGLDISSLSIMSRELSRIVYHWFPEYISLSPPFLAPTMISVRAYPSKQMLPHSEGPKQDNDLANLTLARFSSVWKLGSVLLGESSSCGNAVTPLLIFRVIRLRWVAE